MSKKFNQIIGIWNGIVILCASYVAITIPLEIVFNFKEEVFTISDHVITLIFFLDFIVNYYKYREIRKTPNCQEAYKSKWYLVGLILSDFLAAIPFGLLLSLPFFKLFRLLKLFRVFYLFQTYHQKLIQSAGLLKFIFFIFWILHIIHWIGCGWIVVKGIDPGIDATTNYINAIYWTITTLTTVGYGDILPVSNLQKIYSICVQILGFGVFSFLIGTIASVLLKKEPAKVKYQKNIENLASLIHYRTLPVELQDRIVDFYTFMWKKRLGYDETTFLKSLPENLQTEVALFLKKEVIEKIPLFKKATIEFKREIALLLRPIFLTPGDYAFKTGDHGKEMYFVVDGEVIILTQKEDKIIAKLKSGDYFGEIALLKNKSRTATAKTNSYCDIYVLHKKDFDKLIDKYPGIGVEIHKQIKRREIKHAM